MPYRRHIDALSRRHIDATRMPTHQHGSVTPRTVRWARLWLAWALVLALPWLGLGLAQRQALGPLHVHASSTAMPPSAAAAAGARPMAGVAERAWAWWWAQVRSQTAMRTAARAAAAVPAQMDGYPHPHPHADPHPHLHPHAQTGAAAGPQASASTHRHDGWQRHHHDRVDDSVLALDAAPDDAGAAAAASVLLLVLGSPASSLRLNLAPARPAAWPRASELAFSSWSPSPPLRPPRG